MIRAVAGEALLFFLPFALFAILLVLQRKNPFHWAAWSDRAVALAAGGLLLAIGSLLYTGITSDRRDGPFEPTHMENGRVVPGRFR